MKLKLFCLLLVAWGGKTVLVMEKPETEQLPSIKLKVTDKGLNFIKDAGLALAMKQVKDIKLPDLSGKASTPIGKVKYSLSGLKINSFTLGTSKITTEAPRTIRLILQNAFLQLNGNWRYKYLFISDHGSFDAKANGISVNLAISVGMDGLGKPSVKTGSCSSNIGSISLKVHGGASWLYNLILKAMNGNIKHSVQKQICPAITKAINNQAEKALSKLNVKIPFLRNLVVDASLTHAPLVTSQSIQLLAQGRCFPKSNPNIKFPFLPTVISVPPGTDQMTDVVIGEFLFETLGYSLWSENALDIWITNDMLPKKYQNVTADMFAAFIAGFSKFKGRPLQFRLNVTKPPKFDIGPGVIKVTVELDFLTYVLLKNKTKLLAMNLHAATKASGNLAVSSEKFTASVSSMSATVSAKSSVVGKLPVTLLNFLLPGALRSYVIPAVNKILQKGYPLPTITGVSYVTPKLQLVQGALVGNCDWKIAT
uniref:bactericidal permeability-increasing protein n=1 Tax=Ciona intestinalis TaxID=7719 RepID=UPI000180CA33|nr:bactericidal permeability-increasing protein [Ciona intestinalis]|eukprot:XP_002127451.1 bactericidal permeability-increasing protein [Ciona intestinalis]